VSSIFPSRQKLTTFFAHHFHFYWFTLGSFPGRCHPAPFSPLPTRVPTIFWKFCPQKYFKNFPSGVTPPGGCHPCRVSPGGGPPLPSDATERVIGSPFLNSAGDFHPQAHNLPCTPGKKILRTPMLRQWNCCKVTRYSFVVAAVRGWLIGSGNRIFVAMYQNSSLFVLSSHHHLYLIKKLTKRRLNLIIAVDKNFLCNRCMLLFYYFFSWWACVCYFFFVYWIAVCYFCLCDFSII